MELSDLQQQWKNDTRSTEFSKNFLQTLPAKKTNDGARNLKWLFLFRLISIPIAFTYVAVVLMRQHTVYTTLACWFLIPTSIISIIYFYINYRLLQRLQHMETPVKTTLETHIRTLESIILRTTILLNTIFWIFIVLAEIIVHNSRSQNDVPHWFHRSIGVRIFAYATLFCCMYFYNKYFANYKYKKYIAHLKKVLQQTV